jgi:hypothetical protein
MKIKLKVIIVEYKNIMKKQNINVFIIVGISLLFILFAHHILGTV